MNKDLKGREFDVPQDILDKINHTISGLNGEHVRGVERAKNILQKKKVTYGQLKRLLHDIENMDKVNDKVKYDLCGGDLMEKWGWTHLQNERDFIRDRKNSRMRSNEIGGLDGQRKNSHLKTHSKESSLKVPLNMMKSNSHKTSVSEFSGSSMKLFEEIERIKNLIK